MINICVLHVRQDFTLTEVPVKIARLRSRPIVWNAMLQLVLHVRQDFTLTEVPVKIARLRSRPIVWNAMLQLVLHVLVYHTCRVVFANSVIQSI